MQTVLRHSVGRLTAPVLSQYFFSHLHKLELKWLEPNIHVKIGATCMFSTYTSVQVQIKINHFVRLSLKRCTAVPATLCALHLTKCQKLLKIRQASGQGVVGVAKVVG